MVVVELPDRAPSAAGKPLMEPEQVPRHLRRDGDRRGGAVPGPARRRTDRLGLGTVLVGPRPRPGAPTSCPASASRSGFTATSPTARSRPPGGCGSRWPWPAAWPWRARSIQWVADHRRHHAFADREGDPHSPWRYGATVRALAKGLVYAHCGWLFERESTNRERFAPDLLADRDISRVDRLFLPLFAVSVLGPALIGGLVTWSWYGALTAFFWASLVRIAFLHHVTWSINSICHVYGQRPFATRGRRPGGQLLAAGDHFLRRELAQLAPRRPDLRPPRCAAGPARYLRPDHLVVREGRLGPRRTLAAAATIRPTAGQSRRIRTLDCPLWLLLGSRGWSRAGRTRSATAALNRS